DSPLADCPNLITTPHLGASTEEAQVKVSCDIAVQFNEYFDSGRILNSVNVQLKIDPAIDGYLQASETLGTILAQSLDEPLQHLEIRARGELAEHDTSALAVAALKGYLSAISDDQVNFVNANLIAKERGITLTNSNTAELKEWKAELMVKAVTENHEFIIGGSLIKDQLRVLRFNNYRLDLPVSGNLLVMEYADRPGMVGKYGSILGEHQVNIARMEVSRVDGQGNALVILSLDDPINQEVIDKLQTTVNAHKIVNISL
ncbi:MAG: ACT domain-containing protein, partial [Planctomycetes bacterium]|nr:ACT domain-containing protein [Planctomycetota bacterium]